MNKKECSSCSKEPITKLNISRFIEKLDFHFKSNDLEGAKKTILFWESEAKALNDESALLSVLNEGLGLFRRISDRENALRVADEVISLLDSLPMGLSKAVILTNLATTLSAFGALDKSIKYYSLAEDIYKNSSQKISFEFAALLNNKSSALSSLKRYDEAKTCLEDAIEILKAVGGRDCEIALSLLGIAHIEFEKGSSNEKIEPLLDLAWEYINSENQKRDSNYAFIVSKCAPSYRFFKRNLEADALEEVAKEIYGGAK